MKKRLLNTLKQTFVLQLLIGLIILSKPVCGQYTSIPDANFEQKLIDLGIDTDGMVNGQILTSDAAAVTNTLDVSSSSISDLTGINAFVNLLTLNCKNNSLSSLNVSGISGLLGLNCDNNDLSHLNVNGNVFLINLSCSINLLPSIDVSNNIALKNLGCHTNLLTSLNVSNNPALTHLTCPDNEIESLDLSNNPLLVLLWVSNNALSSLDIQYQTELLFLNAGQNEITNLDVSNNTKLEYLLVPNNHLTSLDVTNNPDLIQLMFYGTNSISSVDVTQNLVLQILNTGSNPLVSLDVSQNEELQSLGCSDHLFSAVDVSNNPKLEVLNCASSSLTSLDVTNNPLLKTLIINFSSVTELDLSNNSDLVYLSCHDNELTSLDLSANSSLQVIGVHHNPMTCLDVRNGNNLIVTAFDARATPNLKCVNVDDAVYADTSAIWSAFIDPGNVFAEDCPCTAPDSDGDGVENDLDNCPSTYNPGQEDNDCDSVGDVCDVCNGVDDTVDNNNDGLPDCAYPPDFGELAEAWRCGQNNDKVLICHNLNNNPQTICVSENAVDAHLAHGDLLGSCTGCSTSFNSITEVGALENNHKIGSGFSAFPNPFQDEINIFFAAPVQGLALVELYALDGQKVVSSRKEYHVTPGNQEIRHQFQELENGIYILRLTMPDGEVFNRKVVRMDSK